MDICIIIYRTRTSSMDKYDMCQNMRNTTHHQHSRKAPMHTGNMSSKTSNRDDKDGKFRADLVTRMQPTGMWDPCKARNPFINQPLLGIILYHLSTRGVRCAIRNTRFRKTQEDMVYDIGFAMVYLIKKWILPISIILFRAMLVPETIAS